jgi:formamidopyrimidine-DNA glycosylase
VPEGIEVELYRRAADATVGRRIASVDAPDPWFLKRGLDAAGLAAAAQGAKVVATRRRGKLLLLDLERRRRPVTLGLRFGMTGRLVVDGRPPIGELEYGPGRTDPSWERFGLVFTDGGRLVIDDPRRLGGVELEPDEDALGPDVFTMGADDLDAALTSGAPLKARLMDQAHVAGLGNLLTDEVLWRCGLDPARPAASLTVAERAVLRRTIAQVLRTLTRRGGSHTGDLQHARVRGGTCPRDGAPLVRRTVGGRTTYSCPAHQR